MLVMTWTRSVRAAAAVLVTRSSGLWNVIRSPADTLEYGPSSIPRHHSTKVVLVNPVAMVGSAMPISMGCDPSEQGVRPQRTDAVSKSHPHHLGCRTVSNPEHCWAFSLVTAGNVGSHS